MTTLPIDTLLDDDPRLEGQRLELMKALYLRSHIGQKLLAEDGFSAKQVIDQLEQMRRDGLIKVAVDTAAQKWSIELTPKGASEAWLAIHGGGRE